LHHAVPHGGESIATEGSNAGIYAFLVLIVVLILGAVAYLGGFVGSRGDGGSDTKKIEIDVGTKRE
jgi:hypothetical protein